MKKNCFITGISGFVGGHLAAELNREGYTVYGIDRRGNKVPGAETTKGDIMNRTSLEDTINRIRPEVIFHLAAQSSVKLSWEKPEETRDVNVEGTRNVLEAAKKLKCRILVVSSAEVYGMPENTPINENHPLKPLSPYADSRVAQEKIVLQHQKNRAEIIIARSFPHTGPGQQPDFVCSSFAYQIALIEKGRNEPIVRVGNLNARRDFSDVRDVVRAYLLLIKKADSGIYNVCSGKSIKIKKVLDMLIKQSRKKISVKKDPKRMRPSDIPILEGDNTLLKRVTGWQPEIEFEQTIRDLLDYWRKKV